MKPDIKSYTQKDIAACQRDAEKQGVSDVLMDPYRVEASIQEAVQRGKEYQREYDEADRKREHRMLVISIWAFVIILVLLFGILVVNNPGVLP